MPKREGKHPHNALSAAAIRNQSEAGRYADGNGLYLVVDKSGNKRWLLRITINAKRRDIGLGGWPTVSLRQARQDAIRAHEIANQGGDPLAERRKAKMPVPTFSEAAKLVHAEYCESWKNSKHRAQWISSLNTYADKHLGSRPVNQIQTSEIVTTLRPIWLTKPETAKRVKQRIGAVLDWAGAKGYRAGENPVSGVLRGLPKQDQSVQHHCAMPYVEIPVFLNQLRQNDHVSALALEFLILTATRTSEVLLATWDEVNLQDQVWTIPAERMKANREHRVPLSDRATEILGKAKALSQSGNYVFPGTRSGKPLSQMALLMLLRRMGIDATTHGFRSTFRDWAAEQTNFPREICEAALAHTIKNKTEAAYKRTDHFLKRRKLMHAWSAFADKSKPAEVAKIRDTA